MAGLVREHISPPYSTLSSRLVVNSFMRECCGPEVSVVASGLSSAVWTANLAIYVPLTVSQPTVVNKMWWINGSAVNGNTDVGIYSADGTTKLTSTGSTANSGTSQRQLVDVTDLRLDPLQFYWMALACNSGSQNYFRNAASTIILDYAGVKQQSGAWSSGLPASATFATPSVAILPLFGFITGTI